jgi:hypothetical protein
MPMFDRGCPRCGEQLIDCFEPVEAPEVLCPECKVPTKRIWIGKGAAVIQDSIEGGVLIHHGICNPDGSPRRFDSHSEIARAAKERGLVNYVEHVGERGSDRSKHTVRWI